MTENSLAPRQLELSARALALGLGIGAVLALGNLYMGLKTGWWDSGMITASILGFALGKPLGSILPPSFSRLENNIVQASAAAVAAMPSAVGLLGALPALEMLGHRLAATTIVTWGLVLGVFGVILAIALSKRHLDETKRPFPTAAATHEVIVAMHESQGQRSAVAPLLYGAAIAGLITWFRDGKPTLVPGSWWFPLTIAGQSAEALLVGVSISPMLICAGALVGLRVSLSLLGGAAIAWVLIAPRLVAEGISRADYTSCVEWLMWPGISLMVANSLTMFAFEWPRFKALLTELRTSREHNAPRASTAIAVLVSAVTVVVAGWLLFDITPLLGAATLLLSIVLIDLCVMIAGSTDVAPYGTLGQLMQMALGLAAPGSAIVNVTGASVAAGASAQTVQTMYALKVGRALGSSPRALIIAQLSGVVLGALLIVPAYRMLVDASGLGSAALPAPFVLSWKALAELTQSGTAQLPRGAGLAALITAVIGVVLAFAERRFPTTAPSAIGIGLAFLIPAASTITIALGAIAATIIAWRASTWASKSLAAAASGGIAGESLIAMAAVVYGATA